MEVYSRELRDSVLPDIKKMMEAQNQELCRIASDLTYRLPAAILSQSFPYNTHLSQKVIDERWTDIWGRSGPDWRPRYR